MKTIVITSARKFIDIDAFACIFAYQELLRLQGQNTQAIITAKLNASIVRKYRGLDFYTKDANGLNGIGDKEFVIMDTSDPDQFEGFVDTDNVSKVFDHHPGFETFWKDKIGAGAIVEPIGAAATLIFREYKKSGLLEKISPMAAELLAIAILSNTLYFQAKISTQEDRSAYEELKKYFPYSDIFEEEYFSEVQSAIEGDIENSLRDDSKSISIDGTSLFIAQLEVWDADHILNSFSDKIETFISDADEEISFLNLIEIGKKRNAIIFRDVESLENIRRYFPEFEYDNRRKIAVTPHVILRKEILSKLYEYKD